MTAKIGKTATDDNDNVRLYNTTQTDATGKTILIKDATNGEIQETTAADLGSGEWEDDGGRHTCQANAMAQPHQQIPLVFISTVDDKGEVSSFRYHLLTELPQLYYLGINMVLVLQIS